ncbi:recombinase family protein [Tepidanaerobacter acetatoxydans]|uniref:recombinase family protein n=1 Tax=Tepidanaerobacter acetatoxydans TaxID=499229 RepID=UPI001BD4F30E|nr:recombinase family protein [Tepidanaerobacter acetatoxydans]
MVTAAIYGRRSVDDDPSMSVDNQINRSIELCKSKGWNYTVYRDDGVSGKDTERKDFQRMMRDARAGKFQYLISYKLDRVSRSVSDFSNLINELQEMNIEFISLTENFDTSSPMGRAMMYIAAVFAQLERETIAQRIRDNMIDMAKDGFYTGGPVNFGFARAADEILIHGKTKKVSMLEVNEEETAHVMSFYDWYNEPNSSIRKTCLRANEEGIKTKNGKLWNSNQMARLLSNPLYCTADEDAYSYFKNETSVIIANSRQDFNGKNGLMYYNRRKPHKKTTRLRDESEWILAVGKHEGVIPGKLWVATQHKLKKNAAKPARAGTATKGLLAYLVKCGKCGGSMPYYPSWKDKNRGYEYGYYMCRKRKTEGKHICDQRQFNRDVLETAIVDCIKRLFSDTDFIEKSLRQANKEIQSKKAPSLKMLAKIKSQIAANETEINNLIIALGKKSIPEELITNRIKELQDLNANLYEEMSSVKQIAELAGNEEAIDIVYGNIRKFNETFDKMEFEEKRLFLRTIIKDIIITDTTAKINIYFMPRVTNSLVFSLCKDMDS